MSSADKNWGNLVTLVNLCIFTGDTNWCHQMWLGAHNRWPVLGASPYRNRCHGHRSPWPSLRDSSSHVEGFVYRIDSFVSCLPCSTKVCTILLNSRAVLTLIYSIFSNAVWACEPVRSNLDQQNSRSKHEAGSVFTVWLTAIHSSGRGGRETHKFYFE